ncbi:DeoR/GlpR family DNA-binding transcription regulator [Catenisphaera adipataccumulans]|uniref:DeoR/GlpR family transcriptional regulator of sugar metabolism n=1 Tax=Catenisphaera adipataccumulans TaxID=700500 RepID=A0A7W8CVH9_9FIRM|nr:DeoR/GlpR family DNA-binding transcription regulator [Catenisphaera adipataccumulans]MBB5182382.1 DeoR/GlpR family transcriptional regulator of sugar metabolism [Catenisphaera adipataccumulans]
MSKKTQTRQDEIYQQLLTQGEVRVNELAAHFSVSMETIRKDLSRMEQEGLLVKTHGGAMTAELKEASVDRKQMEHAEWKKAIARAALPLIQDHTVIFLGPGSTTLALAKLLPLKKDLIIATNSLPIAQLVTDMRHELIFTGGKILKRGKAATGAFTNTYIDSIHIDTAFMGCDGFRNRAGPTTFAYEEMEVKQHVLRQASKKVLLCDASKFQKVGIYTFASFAMFDVLITNVITLAQKQRIKDVPRIIQAGGNEKDE